MQKCVMLFCIIEKKYIKANLLSWVGSQYGKELHYFLLRKW